MPEGRERTEALLQDVIDLSDASETQVTLGGGRLHVVRFAENLIRESLEERWSKLEVQVAYMETGGWRVGHASTTDLTPPSLEKVVQQARDDAYTSPPVADYLELTFPGDLESVIGDDETIFDARTAVAGPVLVADELSKLTLPCHQRGYACQGVLSIGVGTLELSGEPRAAAIANSNGLVLHYWPTRVALSAGLRTPQGGRGRLEATSNSLAGLDVSRLVEEALVRAELPRLAGPVRPGRYRALLEPAAVGAILEYLRPHFSYRTVVQGQSVLADLLDQQIFSQDVRILVNPMHPMLKGRPFDAEGWPSRELTLVDAGAVQQFIYTRAEAAERGVAPTGYDTGDSRGAVPEHLVMEGGSASNETLLDALDHGLVIRHISELSAERQGQLLLVAVAGEDVFVADGGRLTEAANSVTFRIDLVEALSNPVAIGEAATVGDNVAPAIVVESVEVLG